MSTTAVHGKRQRSKNAGKTQQRSFDDMFGVPAMHEVFNRPAALYLLQHADEYGLFGAVPTRTWDAFKELSQREVLQHLLQNATDGQNDSHVQYAKASSDTDKTGRWYAQGRANFQRMSKKLRATLADGLYIDVDFENCGPTLLYNLCHRHGIGKNNVGTFGFKWLPQYVENRTAMLDEFQPFFTRDEAKQIVVQVVYGRPVINICNDPVYKERRHDIENITWLPEMEEEIKRIYNDLASCDEYEEILARRRHTTNRNVKIVSTVLFAIENRCLERLYCFLVEQGILQKGECVLTFDGLMLRDTPQSREWVSTELLMKKAVGYIAMHENLKSELRIKHKPLGDAYKLPQGYEQTVTECYYCIEPGDDQAAADIIVEAAGDCIKKSDGRLFARQHNSVIFSEGEAEVRRHVIQMTKDQLQIMQKHENGETTHYSRNTTKLNNCLPRIINHIRIQDCAFVRMLWQNNLRYLAFTDGVWSFRDRKLLSLDEALKKKIYFTRDTGRPFPQTALAALAALDGLDALDGPDGLDAPRVVQCGNGVGPYAPEVAAHDELMRRIIEPFLPDEPQRNFFLNVLARALAGEIADKRWYVGLGERNCGKGIMCKLLCKAFGPFVQVFGAENLLLQTRGGNQDAAKAQSWMRPHESARLLYSNEISKSNSSSKIDGEIMKRLCSNGDEIECRKNYENEVHIRLQATVIAFANDLVPVDPPDAYQTMHAFKFANEFHDADEITNPSDPMQKNWLPRDHGLDDFIQRPDVIDAFTVLIIQHYTCSIQQPPDIVKEHTQSVKGPAAESQLDRFKQLVQHSARLHDVLFFKEIRVAAEAAGMGRLSDSKIGHFVEKLYGLKPCRPSKVVNAALNGQKKQQDRGFKGLVLCDNGFDETTERARRMETVKQGARLDVVIRDRFTPDDRIG